MWMGGGISDLKPVWGGAFEAHERPGPPIHILPLKNSRKFIPWGGRKSRERPQAAGFSSGFPAV
jgi:hypothetical protein